MHAPTLTYYCELGEGPLEELFAGSELIDFLARTGAAVSLGILDLSEKRARTVQRLNQAGVPVTAWLLLPKEQGYWFNLDNAPQAAARYEQFYHWTQQHGLRWARVGLDIEPDIRAVQALSSNNGARRWAGMLRLLQNLVKPSRLVQGRRAYRDLIERIHADGYPVETYQFPFIADERAAHSSLLQRLTGLVNLPEADREVFMLYSSFVRPWGPGLLWSYAAQAEAIAVGITGGGVELEGALNSPALNWAELQNDLLLAYQHSDAIYIFSLEGCARQNFLPQIETLDWKQIPAVPYSHAIKVENIRQPFQWGLRIFSRPAWLLFALALLTSAVVWIGRRLKR